MKAEDSHVRQAAHPAAFVFGAQGVAGIFDHHQPVTLGQFKKLHPGPRDARHSPPAEWRGFAG